jgi:UDPglucose--hexose-1-phosphate uridylyltransferase
MRNAALAPKKGLLAQGVVVHMAVLSEAGSNRAMAEFRQDPLTGRWVIISPERFAYALAKPKVVRMPNKKFVPLDVRSVDVPNSRNRLELHANAFPAVAAWPVRLTLGTLTNSYASKRGVGEQHLLKFKNNRELAASTATERATFAEFVAQEFERMARNRRVQLITLFRNHGFAAGASVKPPHHQLWALPIPSNEHTEELSWLKGLKTCPTCRLIRSVRPWLVAHNTSGKLFCNPASQFAGALTIVPTRHVRSFTQLEKVERRNLIALLAIGLKKLRAQFGDASFNEIWQEFLGTDPRTHFRIEILPRLLRPASLEHGHGLFINPLVPEKIARILRLKKVTLQK